MSRENMNDVRSLCRKVKERLLNIYSEEEARVISAWLVAHCLDIEPEALVMWEDVVPPSNVTSCVDRGTIELLQHRPIQYVTGQAYFYGLKLSVNPSVLIPRPETEELVRWIYEDHADGKELRIADLGTGSGCILLALAGMPGKPVLEGYDLSSAAIRTAERNAFLNNIEARFGRLDLLDEAQWESAGRFDIIVSNPPYVRESEKLQMKPNVLDYEPPSALFVPDADPLVFYRAIAQCSVRSLNPGGRVYVEINENLGRETCDIFREQGFREVVIRKDLRGKDRMIRAASCSAHPAL